MNCEGEVVCRIQIQMQQPASKQYLVDSPTPTGAANPNLASAFRDCWFEKLCDSNERHHANNNNNNNDVAIATSDIEDNNNDDDPGGGNVDVSSECHMSFDSNSQDKPLDSILHIEHSNFGQQQTSSMSSDLNQLLTTTTTTESRLYSASDESTSETCEVDISNSIEVNEYFEEINMENEQNPFSSKATPRNNSEFNHNNTDKTNDTYSGTYSRDQLVNSTQCNHLQSQPSAQTTTAPHQPQVPYNSRTHRQNNNHQHLHPNHNRRKQKLAQPKLSAGSMLTLQQNKSSSRSNSSGHLLVVEHGLDQDQNQQQLLPLDLKIMPTLWRHEDVVLSNGSSSSSDSNSSSGSSNKSSDSEEFEDDTFNELVDSDEQVKVSSQIHGSSKHRANRESRKSHNYSAAIAQQPKSLDLSKTATTTATFVKGTTSASKVATKQQQLAAPSSTTNVQQQLQGHKQRRLFKCRHCPFKTDSKIENWQHTRIHVRPEKLLTCEMCQFVTVYKHHLEYHQRNHSGYKPFKCDHCDYQCVNKSMLNSHMKSHSSVYQYQCGDCKYATKYVHSLKMHLRKYNHQPTQLMIDVYGRKRGPKTSLGGGGDGTSGATNDSSSSTASSVLNDQHEDQHKQQGCILDLRINSTKTDCSS